MHSSRMCTVRCSGRRGGGVSQHVLGRWVVCIPACTRQWGCLPRGVSSQGGYLPQCMLGYTPLPPVNRITDAQTVIYKNAGKNSKWTPPVIINNRNSFRFQHSCSIGTPLFTPQIIITQALWLVTTVTLIFSWQADLISRSCEDEDLTLWCPLNSKRND